MKTKTTNKILLLWIPILILVFSIFLLIKGEAGIVVGLVLLGMIINGFVDLKLKGLDDEGDERYHFLILKGNNFAHRVTYGSILVLIIIHFLYHPLDTGFVLLLLLLIAFTTEALSTLYFSFKK